MKKYQKGAKVNTYQVPKGWTANLMMSKFAKGNLEWERS